MVLIVVVIVAAAFTRRFELMAPPFGLRAVLAVSADSFVQSLLGFLDPMMASLVVAIQRLGWRHAGEQDKRGQERRQSSELLCHLPSRKKMMGSLHPQLCWRPYRSDSRKNSLGDRCTGCTLVMTGAAANRVKG
jgi:hypothetical protein